MAYTAWGSNPIALGYVKPTPGTPKPILENVVAAQGTGVLFAGLVFRAGRSPATANTGKVYIGIQGMNKSTGAGVMGYMTATDSALAFSSNVNVYEADKLYVDCDDSGDGVLITAEVR